jgi:hypothetical protein
MLNNILSANNITSHLAITSKQVRRKDFLFKIEIDSDSWMHIQLAWLKYSTGDGWQNYMSLVSLRKLNIFLDPSTTVPSHLIQPIHGLYCYSRHEYLRAGETSFAVLVSGGFS